MVSMNDKEKFWETLKSPKPSCNTCIHEGKSKNAPSPCFSCNFNDAMMALKREKENGDYTYVRHYSIYEWNGKYE